MTNKKEKRSQNLIASKYKRLYPDYSNNKLLSLFIRPIEFNGCCVVSGEIRNWHEGKHKGRFSVKKEDMFVD